MHIFVNNCIYYQFLNLPKKKKYKWSNLVFIIDIFNLLILYYYNYINYWDNTLEVKVGINYYL